MPVPFSFSSTLRVGLRVSSAHVLLLTLLTRLRSSECRHPPSVVCLRLRAVFGESGVASFLLLVTTGAVGRGSFSVLCLNSLAAHRDAICVPHVVLRAARSSSVTLWLVHDSMVRFWPPPKPLLSIAPLRGCWFAVSALAPWEGSLHARYFSFTCSAEMSVSLVIVACFAVSFALQSAAIARLILTPSLHASCSNTHSLHVSCSDAHSLHAGVSHAFEFCPHFV